MPMPRAAGTYTLPPIYLGVTGQVILATQHNSPLEDIAAALTDSLPRDGSAGMQTALPMGGYQINNMADGALPTDAATVGQASTAAATAITTAPLKATPVDADTIPLVDSASGNTMKRLTWANLKALFQPANAVLAALSGIGTAVAGDFIYAPAAGVWARLAKGTDGQALILVSGLPAWGSVSGGAPDVILEDQKASGTDGGTFTSGAWQTRTLNTEARDPSGLCTLSTNAFTFTVAGMVKWRAPASAIGNHQSRLYNVTDAAEVKTGSSATQDSSGHTQTDSVGWALVSASKQYRLEHRCQTTHATNGFGQAASFGSTEVYAAIEFYRTA
jgi:hypothetical protein